MIVRCAHTMSARYFTDTHNGTIQSTIYISVVCVWCDVMWCGSHGICGDSDGMRHTACVTFHCSINTLALHKSPHLHTHTCKQTYYTGLFPPSVTHHFLSIVNMFSGCEFNSNLFDNIYPNNELLQITFIWHGAYTNTHASYTNYGIHRCARPLPRVAISL